MVTVFDPLALLDVEVEDLALEFVALALLLVELILCALELSREDELRELEFSNEDKLCELAEDRELRLLLFAADELGVGRVLTLIEGDSSETFPTRSIVVIE